MCPDTYILIIICEIGSISLVDCHDDGYYVFAIHNGRGQDVACGVFSKFINECAEVTILQWKQSQLSHTLQTIPTHLYLYLLLKIECCHSIRLQSKISFLLMLVNHNVSSWMKYVF